MYTSKNGGETSNTITTTTDQSQLNTKRKRPDNYDELTRSQQYIWRKRNENSIISKVGGGSLRT